MFTGMSQVNRLICVKCGKSLELGQEVISTSGRNRKLRHKKCYEESLIET